MDTIVTYSRCSGICKQDLPVENFHKNKSTRTGYDNICKDCSQKKHKLSLKKEHYGLSEEKYLEMLVKQNYACDICGKSETRLSRGCLCELSVDHNHKCCPSLKSCGKCIRALLCAGCNNILGRAHDDIELLEKAIQYLKRHSDGRDQRNSRDSVGTDSSGTGEISI